MSFLDLTQIRKKWPEKASIWSALENWMKRYPQSTVIPVFEIFTNSPTKIDPLDLVEAIDLLVQAHIVKKRFRVIDPNQRIILPDSFSDRTDVPEEVRDNFDRPVRVSSNNIAMVLEHN
jgi:hypothetical protein